ncbi:UNVERIFIED_CONTAM: hypothetical protein FKN15_051823 [Acipenser sinensis]
MKKSRSVLTVSPDDEVHACEELLGLIELGSAPNVGPFPTMKKSRSVLTVAPDDGNKDPPDCGLSKSFTSSANTLGVDLRRGRRRYSGNLQLPPLSWRQAERARTPEEEFIPRPTTLPFIIPPRIDITPVDPERVEVEGLSGAQSYRHGFNCCRCILVGNKDPPDYGLSKSFTSSANTLGVDLRRGRRRYSGNLQLPPLSWRQAERARTPEEEFIPRPTTLPFIIPPRIDITPVDPER